MYNFFKGTIDEVRIYNRALNSTEISELYNATDHSAVREGLVGEWRLEETSGSTAYDTSSSYLQPGQVNEAYEFDGVDDYVEVSKEYPNNLTFSAWVNPYNLSSRRTITAVWDNNQGLWFDFYNSDGLRFITYDGDVTGAVYTKSSDFSTNQWYHVLGTIVDNGDGTGDYKLYLDGQEVASNLNADLDMPSGYNIYIGAENDQDVAEKLFDGKIDEVAIWDRALNSSEIQKIYDRSKDPSNKYYCNGKANLTWVTPTSDIYVAKNKFWNYTLKATCPEIGPPCGEIDVTLDPEEAEKLKEGKTLQVSGGEVTGVAGDNENEDNEKAEEKGKGLWERITGFFVKLFKSEGGIKNEF